MLYCFPGLTRTLLNYGGIRQNSFHSETYDDKEREITSLYHMQRIWQAHSLCIIGIALHILQNP